MSEIALLYQGDEVDYDGYERREVLDSDDRCRWDTQDWGEYVRKGTILPFGSNIRVVDHAKIDGVRVYQGGQMFEKSFQVVDCATFETLTVALDSETVK